MNLVYSNCRPSMSGAENGNVLTTTYPGPTTTSFGFDAFGNRTSMTVSGNTTTYAYDDRITSVTPPSPASVINYTWDDPSRKDDLTARGSDSFSWDYEDRMVSATVNSVTTNFAYGGDGLRDSRAVSGYLA
jgi:YD repeat-containing protein